MGKFLPSATRLRQLARTLGSAPGGDRRSGDRRRRSGARAAAMEVETSGEKEGGARVPLSEVVSDCVKRWFKDTLKEAKAGDVNMQVLVGQMYYSGYGVPRDAQKGRIWITKASRIRTSVWKVSDKRPGYNASDSDSDEIKDNSEGSKHS
ncbi:uncharacterized protein LOC104427816 isoform X1 [Eucalyptus grandis]|uniref:uncharacterized protein LOC104427816 isoform X1 n=2 Tax=Eucalyptus grandis TaxID=71139 RepID=UPI00192ED393|nr:uncharacterized protein LOC104427816 isoform X1 [Eucalyptus grandis]XP_010039222.2 uncharacterized protein LOC104427816 isoform X1 [Eucalyptus grandis]